MKLTPLKADDKTMSRTNHWENAEALLAAQHQKKMRAMSDEVSIRVFCSLLAFAVGQRDQSAGWDRIVEDRWRQKLAGRTKLIARLQREGH
jgi:hypothetical protein